MVFNVQIWSQAATWIICIIYFTAILPQIFLNHKLQSAEGLSRLTLLFFLIGYISESYYAICLGLPLSYKVMVPLGLIAVVILFVQKFYFSGLLGDKYTLLGFALISIVGIGLIPYTLKHLNLVGNMTGWLGAIMWSTYKLPQVYAIYRSKSVAGLSVTFFTLLWLGAFLEAAVAMAMKLPKQTLFNGLYGIVINTTLITMLFIYKERK